MEIFFDNHVGVALFSIEVESSDTVLKMKQKIETSHRIAVSKQTIFFKGKLLLQDHLTLQQCKIVKKSRLVFFCPRPRSHEPNHSISQVLHQTEQCSVPSNSTQGIFNIQDSRERIITNQDSNVMARRNDDQVRHQTDRSLPPSNPINEFLNYDWSSMARSNDNHVVQQTEQSQVSSKSIEEFLCGDDWPATTEGNVNIHDSSKGNNEYQDWLQMEPSPPSNLFGDLMYGEDQPLSTQHFTSNQTYWPGISYVNQGFQTEQSPVPSLSTEQRINIQDLSGNNNQVLQTEQWPVPSISTEQRIKDQDLPGSSNHHVVIDIPDSPVRRSNKPPQNLRIMILSYSREDKPMRTFPVEVNASENVVELKKELEKIQQRNQLYLPEEGYTLLHKEGQRVLSLDKSFRRNCVAHGDTIEVFPGTYTMT